MGTVVLPRYPFPETCAADLRRQNPWWEGDPPPAVPDFRRWPFEKLLTRLEKPIAPILVLRGPRQVGKTTLQLQIIRHLLEQGVEPARICRVRFDDLPSLGMIPPQDEPILRIADWYESYILRRHLNAAARAGTPALFFLDEVQNVPAWDVQLKSLVDDATIRMLVTGSSALQIERGRDSLAGRMQTFEIGPLRLTEIAALRSLGELRPAQTENNWRDWLNPEFWRNVRELGREQGNVRDAAFAAFSERGAFPVVHAREDVPWDEIADYLTETIIRRVIQHDLRVEGEDQRDQQLFELVFEMACRYVGLAPNPASFAAEAKLQLGMDVSRQRISRYIHALDSSLLVRAIRPLETRLRRRRGYHKLCLCDHALRAAWLQETVPLLPSEIERDSGLATMAGHLADNITGYYFASLFGLDVAHAPERELESEVDFVVIIGDKRIPVEVKYQRVVDQFRDTLGLRQFIEKAANNATFGLLITRDDETTVLDPRIICLPLKSLLLVR